MSMNKYTGAFLVALLIAAVGLKSVSAQEVENEFQSRIEFKSSLKLTDKWKLYITPEIRLDESFSIDKYLLELKGVYKAAKVLSLGASYRFVGNARETKATEYLHRYALDATLEKKLNRFKPAFRLKYTNYSEDKTDGEFLRYKAGLNYDIKGSKLTPVISAEAFHELNNNELYKVRYALGGKYKLKKKNSINFGYKFDYYLNEYQNKHILYLGYRIKF